MRLEIGIRSGGGCRLSRFIEHVWEVIAKGVEECRNGRDSIGVFMPRWIVRQLCGMGQEKHSSSYGKK
jgi:hypothetical protein